MSRDNQKRLFHFFPSHEEKFKEQARQFFDRKYLINVWHGFSKENIDDLAADFCSDSHSKYDWVVFHSAPYYAIRVIERVSKRSKVIVQFWGADYADVLIPEARMFLPRTRSEFIGRPIPNTLAFELLMRRWYLLKNKWRRKSYVKALESCQYLCFACGDSEWNWMPPGYQAKRLNWFVNYSSGNDAFWQFKTENSVKRDGVLIGNSAAATNNHLDVLEKLRRAPHLPDKVIIPLSYGSKAISKRVKEVSERFFGNAVVPLLEFLPAQAYFDIIDRCEFVIMGHMRQQALGNLKWAFFTLRTVYMWEGSDVYEYLSSRGFFIGKIDSIEQQGMVPLMKDQLENNKALAREELLNLFDMEVQATFLHESE